MVNSKVYQSRITIPKNIRKYLGVTGEHRVILTIRDNRLFITFNNDGNHNIKDNYLINKVSDIGNIVVPQIVRQYLKLSTNDSVNIGIIDKSTVFVEKYIESKPINLDTALLMKNGRLRISSYILKYLNIDPYGLVSLHISDDSSYLEIIKNEDGLNKLCDCNLRISSEILNMLSLNKNGYLKAKLTNDKLIIYRMTI